MAGEIPAQRASKEEAVSIWWRHEYSQMGMRVESEYEVFFSPGISPQGSEIFGACAQFHPEAFFKIQDGHHHRHNIDARTINLSFILIFCNCEECDWICNFTTLEWRHNERDGVSNHRRLGKIVYIPIFFRRRSKEISKLNVTGLCEGNSPVTDEFPAQKASNAENVPIWWRHHDIK